MEKTRSRLFDSRVVERPHINRHVAGFLADALTIDNAFRPRLAVAELRLVVLAENIEVG